MNSEEAASSTIHREDVVWPGWVQFVMVLPFLGGLGGLIWAWFQDRFTLGVVIAAIVLIVVGVVLTLFRSVVVEFGPEGAAFGFNKLRRRVPRERIVSAAPETYDVARYMGWGYRFGWQARDRAYSVMGYPDGVRLVFDDEQGRRWKVFLSVANAAAAIRALELPVPAESETEDA